MAVEHIPDLADQSVALFIDQFREKPRLEAWSRSFLKECQLLEDVFWDILQKRDIDQASGAQLDVLGKIVGQPRVGATDAVYRLHLRARIRINISNGETVDVIAVAQLLLQTAVFAYLEFYPASFVVDVLDPMLEDPAFTAALIAETRGAGVGSPLHFSDVPAEDTFAFADGDVEQDDPSRGWSNDGGGSGGELIGAI
jgi:hypothetical protein